MDKRFKRQFNPKFNYLDQICCHGANGGGSSSDRYCYPNKSYMRLNHNHNIMDYNISSRGVGHIQHLRNITCGNSTGASPTGNGRIQTKSDLKRQNNELNRMIVLHLNLIQEQNDELGERDREIEKRDNEITRLCIKNAELEEKLQCLQKQFQKRSASPDLKSLPKKIREASTHIEMESFQDQPQLVCEPTPLLHFNNKIIEPRQQQEQVVVTSSNSVVNTKANGEYNGKKVRTIFMQRINKESGYLDRSTSPITNATSSYVEKETLNIRRQSQHLDEEHRDIGCEGVMESQVDCSSNTGAKVVDPLTKNTQQVGKSYVTIENDNCLEIHENGDACDNDEKGNLTENLKLILPQENKDAFTHLPMESQLCYASVALSTPNQFQNLHKEKKELPQNDELKDSKITKCGDQCKENEQNDKLSQNDKLKDSKTILKCIDECEKNDQNDKPYEKEREDEFSNVKNIESQDNRINNMANNQLIEENFSNKDNDKYHSARKKDNIVKPFKKQLVTFLNNKEHSKQLEKQETTELRSKFQDNLKTKKMMLKLKNIDRKNKPDSVPSKPAIISINKQVEIKPSILSESINATVVHVMLKSEDSITTSPNSIDLKQSIRGVSTQEKRNVNEDEISHHDSLPVAPKNILCYSTKWMYPTRAWEDGEFHCDLEFYLEEANELNSDNPKLEIPEWKDITIPPITCEEEVTENISDESFNDRNKKRVAIEIKRKRRDAIYLEEQFRRFRNQEKEQPVTQKILPLTTFYNLPEEVKEVCFVSDVPVQAFGECLISLDCENNDFILPWLDVDAPPITTTPIITFGCKAVSTTAAQAQLQQLNSSYVFIKRPKRRNQTIQNRHRVHNQ